MKSKKFLFTILAIIAVLSMSLSSCATQQPAGSSSSDKKQINVALILGGSANDMSWDYGAYTTLKQVADKLGYVNIMGVAENVAEGDSEPFLRDYADKGADVIIANSFGFFDAAQKVTADHPNLVAVFPGGDQSQVTKQVGTYYPLTYQATYLIGMTAALSSKTGKVGYILSNPIPPLLSETNAFIQGVRDTNPKVQTSVIVTGSWYDPPRETEAAQAMVDSGVDFIAFELNALVTIDVAKKANIMVAPPFIDQSYLAPNNVAVSSLWNWSSFYEELFTKVKAGTWKAGVEYWGIDKGMADISKFGPMISKDVVDKVMAKRQEIISGKFVVPNITDKNLWEQ